MREVALLPDQKPLRAQILMGDLDRLRRFYDSGPAFRRALDGVWLPDSLAGMDRGDVWPRTFGFAVSEVSRFAEAGFHPAEVAVFTGHFSRDAIRVALLRLGYHGNGVLLSRGADGSIDSSTAAGRLVLSALDRVRLTRSRLVAASTTSLARDAVARNRSMAMNSDVGLAARALGEVTAAAIKPAESIQPPAGVAVTPLARKRARWIAAGIDDRGPAGRTVRIVLVYPKSSQAKADATVLAAMLPKSS